MPVPSASVAFAADGLDPEIAARLKPAGFAPDGRPLITAVAQDATTGAVLMVAWMDGAALAATLKTGRATYYSRSRAQQWVKGESSGHTQLVREVSLDCDGDALLLKVEQLGGACHTGERSCFDADRLAIEAPPASGTPASGQSRLTNPNEAGLA